METVATRMEGLANTALLRDAVPKANVFEATVEKLGQSIKLGLLKPGQQLPPERELAELIGVSRATVRSAIQVLTAGGFFVARRGRTGGTFVVDRPPVFSGRLGGADHGGAGGADFLKQFNDRRLVIEAGTCDLAAERITDEQIIRLRERVGRLAEHVTDRDAFRVEDALFHIAIAEATGNARLVQMVAELQAELGDLIGHVPPSEDALAHSNQQHARIVAALAKRDRLIARRAMEEHLSGTVRFLQGLLPQHASNPSAQSPATPRT
jgi:DNA-binding FadR family transcriptional regulator